MEGGDGEAARFAAAEHGGDALLHFARGFVGEGDGGDVAGGVARVAYHVGDFFGDDAGFAAACAGEDEKGAAEIAHGFLLLGVELHGVGPSERSGNGMGKGADYSGCGGGRLKTFQTAFLLRKAV